MIAAQQSHIWLISQIIPQAAQYLMNVTLSLVREKIWLLRLVTTFLPLSSSPFQKSKTGPPLAATLSFLAMILCQITYMCIGRATRPLPNFCGEIVGVAQGSTG
jgi:hypothetical protein